MNKGCMYWLFVGFWIEPMIWLFKVFLYIMKELICAIINGIGASFSRKNKYSNINFDLLEGHEFEYFCADLLRDNGFSGVRVTQGSGDHGIDILASKDGMKYAIQCKCYSKNVGNKAVQEAYSGKDIYRTDIAVVMTNRYFTEQARSDARKLGVELWDRNKLMYFIHHAKGEDEQIGKTEIYSCNETVNTTRSVFTASRQLESSPQAKRPIIQEEKLLKQREVFDNAIEEFKKKKEGKIVYDKERGIYPAGEYTVGEDISTGRYLLKARDKKQSATIAIYQSYQKYLEHEYISYEMFDGDYFTTIRENGLFVVVKYADFQKMDI